MPSFLDRQEHDLGVRQVPKQSPTDIRVPTAEEFTLDVLIRLINNIDERRSQAGWIKPPTIATPEGRKIVFSNGLYRSPVISKDAPVNKEIVLPALEAGGLILRYDYIAIVDLIMEVGQEGDPLLGQFTFQYKEVGSTVVQTATQENTRRFRVFSLYVLKRGSAITLSDINGMFAVVDENSYFTPSNTSVNGFSSINQLTVWADEPFVPNVEYRVIPESVVVNPLIRVKRLQNYTEKGYVFGHETEDPLVASVHCQPEWGSRLIDGVDDPSAQRIMDIMSGIPGRYSSKNYIVKNLIPGAVIGNNRYPGEGIFSLNGSAAIGNDQRVSFTNEKRTQKYYTARVTATVDTSGRPIVSIGLNTDSPLGTMFSLDPLDHHIYDVHGVDQTKFGQFIHLGSQVSLQWVGGPNTSITPGATVYINPGIIYPAGSGISEAFSDITKAWLGGSELNSNNIKEGYIEDLEDYLAPTNNESFYIVYGKERGAIHYILKKISFTANANGIGVVPQNQFPGNNIHFGNFAFIDGIEGRIDKPIVTGLQPNVTYSALVYYPPRTTEAWQFLMEYTPYQGLGQSVFNLLNNGKIVSHPRVYVHTQGGGNSVFRGVGQLQFESISNHLPSVVTGIKNWELNNPVYFDFENQYPGPRTFTEIPLLPGNECTLPYQGMKVKTQANALLSHVRSVNGILLDAQSNIKLGFAVPGLISDQFAIQSVISFVVQTVNSDRYLVIATNNNRGNTTCVLDSSMNTAIDVFYL